MVRHVIALLLIAVGVSSESVHWQWREMKCAAKGEKAQKTASPCEMSLKETEADDKLRTAPFEPCFEAISSRGSEELMIYGIPGSNPQKFNSEPKMWPA
ncbi:hypothetical protein ANCCAN_05607 [Ancylostoma caninum]|uniref:DUF7808 domain-containing protein n=1 Tax=Ancylostoma caninum TaxID=29170 RepID=A0A368GXL5_ANCCA|nr:hypothetical protein ANCCAN_05607 [Ancylostoma caninum]